jgi:predicted lipoprotein
MKNKSAAFRRTVWTGVIVALVVAMGLGTKVVSGEELAAATPEVFNSVDYGATTFPIIQAAIEENAHDLGTVAAALAADQAAATAEYGVVEGTSFPVFSVTFTAVAGAVDAAGMVPFVVDGVPATVIVRMQTGPAINGTDLRDATGTIHFPDFTNQIEYQDAGAALNAELKVEVLAQLDAASLAGKTVTVTGAFQLVNPAGYLITPVKVEVK